MPLIENIKNQVMRSQKKQIEIKIKIKIIT